MRESRFKYTATRFKRHKDQGGRAPTIYVHVDSLDEAIADMITAYVPAHEPHVNEIRTIQPVTGGDVGAAGTKRQSDTWACCVVRMASA